MTEVPADTPSTPVAQDPIGVGGLPYFATPPGGPPLQIGVAAQLHFWQGQFPPPEAVERYERVSPGAFSRMIAMAEFAQTTQRDETLRSHTLLQADTRRGQILGAATTFVAMIGAIACVITGAKYTAPGAYVVGGAFLGLPLMAVITRLFGGPNKPS